MITAILKRDILDVKENFLISHELEHFASLLEKEMATHSVFLPEESQGWGTWWAAVCGVAQSQIQLKQLSSSSMRIKLGKKKKKTSLE